MPAHQRFRANQRAGRVAILRLIVDDKLLFTQALCNHAFDLVLAEHFAAQRFIVIAVLDRIAALDSGLRQVCAVHHGVCCQLFHTGDIDTGVKRRFKRQVVPRNRRRKQIQQPFGCVVLPAHKHRKMVRINSGSNRTLTKLHFDDRRDILQQPVAALRAKELVDRLKADDVKTDDRKAAVRRQFRFLLYRVIHSHAKRPAAQKAG